jgi:signal transduction histidine kinase
MRSSRILALVFALAVAAPPPLRAAEVPAMTEAPISDLEAKLAQARQLHLTDSTRSRALAEESLALARARGDRHNAAVAHLELAIALRRQNQNGAAVRNAREALALVETLGNRPLLRRTLKEVGHTYWAFGDAPNATDYFQQALRLCEDDGDVPGQTDAHAGLGSVAGELGDHERSRLHTAKALALAEAAGDEARVALYAANLASRYFDQNDHATARALNTRSLALLEKLNRRTDADDVRVAIARIDQAEGRLEAAERTLREVLPRRRRLRGRIKLSHTLVQLAQVLRLQSRHEEAVAHLEEAWGHADGMTSRGLRISVLDGLAATHEARGDFPAAIAALRRRQEEAAAQSGEAAQMRAAEVREAFAAERREAEIVRLRTTEAASAVELRAKEAELRIRRAELESVRWQRYGLLSALGFGAITLGALASRHRATARANRRILEQAHAAQRTAEEADRVKTRFLGIASNDIRGPLGNIINLTASLRTDTPAPELQAECCDMIGSEAQRVICLVDDLMVTAALEAQRLDLHLAPMDFGSVVSAIIARLRTQAEAKRQTLVFPQPAPGAGATIGDAARLELVVANVLSNAIKFSPPGETIAVSLVRCDRLVVLTVRDRGAGISEDDIPRLFAPFERIATHPTAAESSHGLGLSIAQEIVRRHGGRIRVESKPGDGTTFLIELPADAESSGRRDVAEGTGRNRKVPAG